MPSGQYVGSPYEKEMSKELRDPTLVKLEVFGSDETITFTQKDIIEITQVNDVDPISRRLPKFSADIELLDPSGEIYANKIWMKKFTPISLTYIQILDDGSEFEILPSYDYFFNGADYAKGRTVLHCCGIMDVCNTVTSWGCHSNAQFLMKDISLNLKHYIPSISITGSVKELDMPGSPLILSDDVREAKTIADAVMTFGHGTGSGIYSNGSCINIKFLTKLELASKVDQCPVISISDQIKDQTVYSKSERLSELTYTAVTVYGHEGSEVPLQFHTEYSGEETWLECGGRPDNTLYDWANTDSEVPVISSGYEMYPKGVLIHSVHEVPEMKQYVGHTLTINTYRKLVSSSKKASYPVFKAGKINQVGNDDFMDYRVKKDFGHDAIEEMIIPYYTLMHTLKIEYRGDPAIEPGDIIKIACNEGYFSDGKSNANSKYDIRALVIANNIKYTGSLHGEMIVKLLSCVGLDMTYPIKAQTNTVILDSGIVKQVQADTIAKPYMILFAYDSNGKLVEKFRDNEPFEKGEHTFQVNPYFNHDISYIIYGVYGKLSTMVKMRTPYLLKDKFYRLTLNLLNTTQGSIEWSGDTLTVESKA